MVASPDELELPVLIVVAKDAVTMTSAEDHMRRIAIQDVSECIENLFDICDRKYVLEGISLK